METVTRGNPGARRAAALEASSVRIDARNGVREELAFFGSGPARMFGCLHIPIHEPVGGLLICPPYQAELHRSYRREVLLARHLAARGVAVQRFHYRGAGHSDGDPSAVTVESMCEDALAAADRLRRMTGVSEVAVLGTRLGGLVAASTASSARGHLALWEPVVDPARYFDEILRFRVMYEMKAEDGAAPSPEDLVRQLRADGSVDVLGHPLERLAYDSAIGRSLADAVGGGTESVLLVQVGMQRGLRAEYATVIQRWEGRGLAVESHVVQDRETWWISPDMWQVHERHIPTRNLVATTGQWVRRRMGVDA